MRLPRWYSWSMQVAAVCCGIYSRRDCSVLVVVTKGQTDRAVISYYSSATTTPTTVPRQLLLPCSCFDAPAAAHHCVCGLAICFSAASYTWNASQRPVSRHGRPHSAWHRAAINLLVRRPSWPYGYRTSVVRTVRRGFHHCLSNVLIITTTSSLRVCLRLRWTGFQTDSAAAR